MLEASIEMKNDRFRLVVTTLVVVSLAALVVSVLLTKPQITQRMRPEPFNRFRK
jgi:hypothetical protein